LAVYTNIKVNNHSEFGRDYISSTLTISKIEKYFTRPRQGKDVNQVVWLANVNKYALKRAIVVLDPWILRAFINTSWLVSLDVNSNGSYLFEVASEIYSDQLEKSVLLATFKLFSSPNTITDRCNSESCNLSDVPEHNKDVAEQIIQSIKNELFIIEYS
jgi:hypothetical protein